MLPTTTLSFSAKTLRTPAQPLSHRMGAAVAKPMRINLAAGPVDRSTLADPKSPIRNPQLA